MLALTLERETVQGWRWFCVNVNVLTIEHVSCLLLVITGPQ